MSSGHDHASHGAAHGHGDHGHGSGPGDDVPAHGPAEIPPPPAVRSISPDRGEYEQAWPGALLLWPIVWIAAGFLFYAAARRWSHPVERAHAPHASISVPAR